MKKYVLAHENKILLGKVQANMLSKNPLPTYVWYLLILRLIQANREKYKK